MKPEVERALEEIKAAYLDSDVTVREDGEGGAYVIVEKVDPGGIYQHDSTWIGTRITFQYPYADTYPHYVRGDLARKDGRPLGEAMSPNQTFEGRPAIQISRKSNNLNPNVDTAAIKLQKVLLWLRSHP